MVASSFVPGNVMPQPGCMHDDRYRKLDRAHGLPISEGRLAIAQPSKSEDQLSFIANTCGSEGEMGSLSESTVPTR